MSKPKIWTLPELLDRIWTLSRGKRTAVATGELRRVVNAPPGSLIPCDRNGEPTGPYVGNVMEPVLKRIVTGWDEDYKPRTYELNKISAASAAALYERIRHMRAEANGLRLPRYEEGWRAGFDAGHRQGTKDTLFAQEKAIALLGEDNEG